MVKEEMEDSEDEWIHQPEFLLPRFNTVHSLVQSQVEYGDINKARENYQKLLAVYDEINMSNLNAPQKQDSYRKLMEVFGALSSPDNLKQQSSFLTVGKYLFPVSVLVIVLLIIIFAKPEFSLTGLAALGENSAPTWVGGNPEFDIIGKTTINLDTYFDDDSWSSLDYAVTDAPNLNVDVDNNLLTIKADYNVKGVRIVHIVASDGELRTRITAKLNIY